MGLLGVLLLSFGSFCIASAIECIPETERCSEYWEKTHPHKDLKESEDELNSWCSKQALFYQCLEDVLLEGKNGNLSYLPTNLLISKLFSQDLCSDSSKNRKRLLDNAKCINQLDTGFCILPEYLDIVTPDDAIPSTRCSQAEKTFSCIAATMVLNCGFDAARVYRTMLKITRYSDEVCGIEQSDGIPPCGENRSKSADKDEKLSQLYYGLFHRIGDILEQNEELNNTETIPEDSKMDVNNVLTEAIQSMIDNLDKNAISEECDNPDCLNLLKPNSVCSENITEYKPHMKNPIITEVFREVLFYNYSGIEFAAYWRQPEYNIFDKFDCDNLAPSYMKVQVFRCRADYRHSDPDCLSNATVHEKVTPEFIRNFDPEVPCDSKIEFGPRPDWMKELDQMYEDKRIRDQTTSTTESTATEAPEVLATSSTLLHVASSTLSFEDFDKNWYKYLDLNAINMNSPLPNDVHWELLDLLMPDMKTWVPPATTRFKVRDSMYTIMYNSEFGEKVENITCSRIDECHPNGRGLFKCRVWPRKIEVCDTCGKIPPADIDLGITYARPRKQMEALYEKSRVTEPTTVEYELENQTTDESHKPTSSTEYEKYLDLQSTTESENDFESLNDEGYVVDDHKNTEQKNIHEMNFDLVPDSQDDQVRILSKVSNLDEDSEVVYAIHDAEDGESVILATEDGLVTGKILFIKDESDFENKYFVATTSDAE